MRGMGHEIREPPGVARVGACLGGTARREGWDCYVLVKREPFVHAACKLRVRCLRTGTAHTLRYVTRQVNHRSQHEPARIR